MQLQGIEEGDGMNSETRNHVMEFIHEQVRAGFAMPDQIASDAVDVHSDLDPNLDEGEMLVLVESALARYRREEDQWSGDTDHDRVVAAFTELYAQGILACEDCGSGLSDGASIMFAELDRLQQAGTPARGFTFFHRQDAESVLRDAVLCLAFGADTEEHAASVARDVVAALGRQGLSAEWKGSVRQRILVHVPDWRVRRFSGKRERPSMRLWSSIWGR
jgi:hypothetical protein